VGFTRGFRVLTNAPTESADYLGGLLFDPHEVAFAASADVDGGLVDAVGGLAGLDGADAVEIVGDDE
jgi:hypothetical protein